ncbi:MAG: hydrogenase iron-sulfur subunit [Candidatus Kapabacteria bacterium]|jgi:quinone-modifying oxidoreductase subunit QmoB|nr:hydrogenase iron-sulfur subunit [Candidatus Kapabacteria bacterium]
MADAKKFGIYICPDFEISKAIDCEKLAEDLKKEEHVHLVKVVPGLCTTKGADLVRDDIKAEELDGVVIGASSLRYHTDIFKFDILTERVNLREGVAWSHEPNNDDIQDLATDYMRMGLIKGVASEIPEPMVLDINDTVMVVGGGFTGMTAAIASAKAGYPVVIAEKAPELGGFMRKLHKLTPRNAPHYDLELNPIDELIGEIEAIPKIKVLTSCVIEKTSGQPGMFDVEAKIDGKDLKFQVGTIIQATGWKPYNPEKLGYLGYGKFKNVITNIEMEALAKAGNIVRPSDSAKVQNIVFVQCAGSRDKDHLPYCSSVCCMTSLKQAMYLRETYPDANIYVIYKDMRTPGKYEQFYKKVQNEDNIFLTKGEISEMADAGNDNIRVDIDGTLIGEKISIEADLVVLAAGMVPSTVPDKIELPEDPEEDFTIPTESCLNLKYIQGPELPTLHYGFPDSHYICFPYETRRTGIYACGSVRQPMDTLASKNDAFGASLKAMQILENIRIGTAVHPRSGDRTFPDFFFQRCTQCKRCTEECPFGALEEDIKGTPMPNPNRCRRCGICMGACPERIISFKNYSVQIVSQMIKSIYVPTEEDDDVATPRIIAFLCENDAYPSLDIVGRKRMKISPHIRVIPVRCLGSVSTSWIADSLAAGFDGALLIGCKYGDDYQCHFIKGSELANQRMENVQEKLKQLVLEPERVELHMLSIDEYDKLPDIFNTFAKVIEDMGPNPYKEM